VGNVAANHVAKWDGSGWSALSSGIDDLVLSLATSGTNLYAGGFFSVAGGVAATNIARWDGKAWSALGSGMDNDVRALVVSGGDVYAGGSFTTAGGRSANHVAKWNGTNWSALGSGVDDQVLALAVSEGGNVYAGGFFTKAGGLFAGSIANWNGSSWSPVGSAIDGVVVALATSGNDLYAAGYFTAVGTAGSGVAKWDGSNWTPLGAGMDGSLSTLAVSGGYLYAGGDFSEVNNADGTTVAANRIAKWNGNSWSSFGSGINDFVWRMATSGSNVYAGGSFTIAGDSVVNRVAKWDGSRWSRLGFGLNNYYVSALEASSSNLYAGGEFTFATNADGNVFGVNNIARWDGNRWLPLGTGVNDRVEALQTWNGELYAGGYFTSAGSKRANFIAKWNGASWSSVGLGLNDYVWSLAVSGSNLYVGGGFTVATNIDSTTVPVNRIARWDGTRWSPLGSGLDGSVLSLAVLGGDLYASGYFNGFNRVAKWDGNTWSALGSGVNGVVVTLATFGNELYAGGYFTVAGGNPANSIAKWDGNNWSGFGSGINGSVSALTFSGGNMYVGGIFTMAGGKLSAYAAMAVLSCPDITLMPQTFADASIGMRYDESVTASGVPPFNFSVSSGSLPDGLSLSTTGVISGTPTNQGLFSFTIRAADKNGCSGSSNYLIEAKLPNHAPVAEPQLVLLDEDSTATITLRGSDLDNDTLGFSIVDAPSHGTLLGSPPNLTYAPETNFNGIDSFTFKVNDGWTDSVPATISILVSPVNDAPIAQGQLVFADEDTSIVITLSASDADEDSLTFTLDNPPSHGLLTGTGTNLTYLPETNYFGRDSFSFHVNDSHLDSDKATIDIEVKPINDPPVADVSGTLGLILAPNETNATVVLDGSRSFDIDDELLQYHWFLNGSTNCLATGIVAIVILPVGTNSVMLTVSDSKSSSSQTILIEVITFSQALERLVAVVDSDSSRRKPLITSLTAAIASIDRGNPTAALNQLGAFQNKVRSEIEPLDPELAQMLIDNAQQMIDALTVIDSKPRLVKLSRHPNGGVHIEFSAPSLNIQVVAASTNLVDWELIGVAHDLGNAAFEFEDRSGTNFETRFYRIISP